VWPGAGGCRLRRLAAVDVVDFELPIGGWVFVELRVGAVGDDERVGSTGTVADVPAPDGPDRAGGPDVSLAAAPSPAEPVVVRIWSMISAFLLRALALRPSALAIANSWSLSFDSRTDCSSACAVTIPTFPSSSAD
jgi:hypothetical protein